MISGEVYSLNRPPKTDLQQSLKNRKPRSYWLSGFFFPQGTVHNSQNKHTYNRDTASSSKLHCQSLVKGKFVFGLQLYRLYKFEFRNSNNNIFCNILKKAL